MRDFDRPLDRGGQGGCRHDGRSMLAAGYVAGRVLCSSARRARETLDGLAAHGRRRRTACIFLDRLYTEDAQGYLGADPRQWRHAASLLVIGHNPMMEDLASAISRRRRRSALAAHLRRLPDLGAGGDPLRRRLRRGRPGARLPGGVPDARRAQPPPVIGGRAYMATLRPRLVRRLASADELHRRGADRPRHAGRPRGRPVFACRCASA